MDIEMFVVFSLFGSIAIWYSLDAWIAPDKFINRMQKNRAKAYKSGVGFVVQLGYGKYLDKEPKLELWLARLGFCFVYAVAAFGIYKSF